MNSFAVWNSQRFKMGQLSIITSLDFKETGFAIPNIDFSEIFLIFGLGFKFQVGSTSKRFTKYDCFFIHIQSFMRWMRCISMKPFYFPGGQTKNHSSLPIGLSIELRTFSPKITSE